MVWIQNQLVGSAIGQRIVLECQSEAFPKSINYWMKNETIITLGEFWLRKNIDNESLFNFFDVDTISWMLIQFLE